MNHIFYNKNVFQTAEIKTSDIVFNRDFRKMCDENSCGRYGSTWNCPPATGSFDEIVALAKQFQNAFIFSYKGHIDSYKNDDRMDEIRKEATEILDSIATELRHKKINFRALGCSSCKVCKKCTYPNSPCRFPNKAFPPIEAFCIDVMDIAKKTNMTVFENENSVIFFCMILY